MYLKKICMLEQQENGNLTIYYYYYKKMARDFPFYAVAAPWSDTTFYQATLTSPPFCYAEILSDTVSW